MNLVLKKMQQQAISALTLNGPAAMNLHDAAKTVRASGLDVSDQTQINIALRAPKIVHCVASARIEPSVGT